MALPRPSHTPSQLRRTTPRTQLTDTPTPAPSSGHTSHITSLKPVRSRSNMAADYRRDSHPPRVKATVSTAKTMSARPGGGPTAPVQHRAPLGQSFGRSLNAHPEQDDLDHLEIATDGTERQRRTLEEEIRRGMGELHLGPASPPASFASLGFGDLSDADPSRAPHSNPFQTFRARIEDPSESSSSESLGEDFSLRLGMASGRRPGALRPPSALSAEDEPDSDHDLTYLTLERTITSPPRPPLRPTASIPAAVRPQPSQQNQQQPVRPVFGSGPSDSRRVFGNVGNTVSPAAAYSSKPKTTSAHAPRLAPYPVSPAADASRVRLPDVTGLTEGLSSPVRARGHQTLSDAASAAEGAALSGALGQLKTRLASLERENALSSTRVRELEARIKDDEQRAAVPPPSGGAEWEQKLREEQERREALEALVSRLRSHVTHLTHSLQDHSTTLAALRSAPPPATLKQTVDNAGLVEDVATLRAGLDGLGVEVDAVKQVVNGLVRERDAAQRWDEEEADRRAGMEFESLSEDGPEPVPEGLARRGGTERQRDAYEDPDKTPKANVRQNGWRWTGPDTPKTGRSFLDAEEIERLRRDLAQEQARRSPTPRPRRTKFAQPEEIERKSYRQQQRFEAPVRPSTAPLPSRPAPVPVARRHGSYESSIATVTPPPPRRAHRSGRLEHEHEREHERDDGMRESFERAEKIFRSVAAPKADAADAGLCSICRRRRKEEHDAPRSAPAKMQQTVFEPDPEYDAEDESVMDDTLVPPPTAKRSKKEKRTDPRTALEDVLKDLEADFELHKRIYMELSDQYRRMDSRVEGAKRRTLADHLKESIDTLELKADQVKRLHDLLHSPPPPPAARLFEGRMREGVV